MINPIGEERSGLLHGSIKLDNGIRRDSSGFCKTGNSQTGTVDKGQGTGIKRRGGKPTSNHRNQFDANENIFNASEEGEDFFGLFFPFQFVLLALS